MQRFLTLIIAIAAFSAAAPVGADWSHDPESNDAVVTAAGDQLAVQLVPDGVGGQYVAWLDRAANNSIVVQRYSATGQALWGAGVTGHAGFGFATDFVLTADGSGGALLAVQDSDDATYFHVHAQRLDRSGSKLWGAAGIKVAPDIDEAGLTAPTLAAAGDGGALLAWVDRRGGNNDIYAQRISSVGTRQWSNTGYEVCFLTSDQVNPTIAPDGQGGAYIGWTDSRNAGATGDDIYLQYVNGAGSRVWPSNGLPACTAAANQGAVTAGSDGAGGVILAWSDARGAAQGIYAQRLLASGNYLWTFQGAPVCTAAAAALFPQMVTDEAGNAWFVWADDRSDGFTGLDVYIQGLRGDGSPRLTPDGVLAGGFDSVQTSPRMALLSSGDVAVGWTDTRDAGTNNIYAQLLSATGEKRWGVTGRAVCQAPFGQDLVAVAGDAKGGAVMAWDDFRATTSHDIYLQRVDRTGFLGEPAPNLTGVRDFPQDQGGVVRLDWEASWLDAYGEPGIINYLVWSRFEGAAKHGGAAPEQLAALAGVPVDALTAVLAAGWTFVGNVDAFNLPAYGFNAPTFADSTAAGTPVTEFMIMAATTAGLLESNVRGGWSVDNLAPGAPVFLTIRLDLADAVLGWAPSGWYDEDLHHYHIYRSLTPGVILNGANRLASSTGPTWVDPSLPGGEWYYVVTAVDVHGNEGPPSNEVMILGISAVDEGELPRTVELVGAWPNPFNPATTLTYRVPRSGTVSLAVFDVSGRRLATLVDGPVTAGEHQVAWDGKDAAGRPAGSGVYFARFATGEMRTTLKLVLAK